VATNGIGYPEADYVLTPGKTYYAFDPQTATYWAASSLELTPSAPSAASVPLQDAGADQLYTRPAGGPWTVQDDGPAGEPCPVIPARVLAAWHWAPGTCRPPI